MAELNEKQKDFYNNLIANEVDAETAEKLVTGELSAADYKLSLDKTKATSEEELFTNKGYDVDLMKTTKKNIKKKKDRAANSAAADDFSEESIFLAEYKPSKKELVESYGINAEKDNELPSNIRMALGFSLADEDLAKIDAKKLYKNYLIEEKKYNKELVESLDESIEFKYQELPDFDGKGKSRVLTYKVPKELGGTNKWTVTNSPGLVPNAGDLKSIIADAGVVTAAIAGGVGGSYVAPIAGTAAGSASAVFSAELIKLYAGKEQFGLASNLSDDDFFSAAMKQAAITAGIDLVATPAFLLTGQAIKKMFMTSALDKISSKSIKNMINSGKLDNELIKNLDDAKAILKDNGIDEKLADEYLAANVAKAFKNPALVPDEASLKSTKFSGPTVKEGEEMAAKSVRINDTEQKLIKELSGLDNVKMTSSQKDDIINDISAKIRNIRQTEIDEAANKVKLAEGNIDIVKRDLLPDPQTSYIDNIGITFNDLNYNVKNTLSALETSINRSAVKNNVRVNVDAKDSIKVINKIINEHNTALTKRMKAPTKKNGLLNDKEYMKKYQANEFAKTLEATLGGVSGRKEVLSVSQILKDGLKSLDDMSFKQAVTWRAILRGAENNATLPTPVLNAIKKAKGTFNDAIEQATSKNEQLAADVAKYDSLLVNYRNGFLDKLSKEIGYGPSKRVTRNIEGRVGKSRSLFTKFIDDTNESIDEALKLKELIDSKAFTVAQTNKINNSLYENYFNKVFPKKSGGKGLETHEEFIKRFGANYKIILGDEKYAKFVKSNKDALKLIDEAVNAQIKVNNAISEALPGMPINVLDTGSETAIVQQLLTKMKSNNVSQLVKNLSNSQEGLAVLNDTRKFFVNKMLNETYAKTPNGQIINGRMNGQLLDDFLTQNKEIIDQLFSKEFTSTYRTMANALRMLQDDSLLGTANALTVTDAANTAGLFIDIFAGPLNHNRLVVNRLARLYDKFNLGGDNINLLMDYKMAIEAAKRNFLGGNYPIILDTLGSSSKPVHKNILKRLLESIGLTRKYKGINIRTLATKEYLKEKSNIDEKGNTTFGITYENPMPDDGNVFTAVDKVLSGLGKEAKKDVLDRTTNLVKQFKTMWFGSGENKKGNVLNKDFAEEEFNEKLK